VRAVERALDELFKTEARFAEEALCKPLDRTAYGYGHACGMFQAIRLARSILERCVNEDDAVTRRRET
jgi:hypothetical protein